MTDLFLSYSRKDETFVRQLASWLSFVGIEFWIDIRDIPAGRKWWKEVQKGLDICKAMLFIVSPDSVESDNVEEEWHYYRDEHKPIIPILLKPAKLPYQLRGIQYIDFHKQDYSIAFRMLLSELERQGIGSITVQTQMVDQIKFLLPEDDKLPFLLPKDDGLPTRTSHEYARYKLLAVQTYIEITNNSMKNKPWRDRYYIDLFAGPGKNKIGNSIVLGSPLIALTALNPFTQYRFNEAVINSCNALKQRVSASPMNDRVVIYQEDANTVVQRISEEIRAKDRIKDGLWSTLNAAFLDPEGLELHWQTVESLARVTRMDLIINFSTSGLLRAIGAKEFVAVDRFFGTEAWKTVYDPHANAAMRRRALIDFYLERLKKFGYTIEINPDMGGDDIAFKNSQNTQVYSLIFASKHGLGDKFWKATAKRTRPPRLLGFE